MVDSNSTVYVFVLNDKYFYSVKSNKNTIKINDKNQLEYVKYSFDSNDKYKATKVYSDYNNTVIEVPFLKSDETTLLIFPPSTTTSVPSSPLHVFKVTLDTLAIEGKASPRNPKLPM